MFWDHNFLFRIDVALQKLALACGIPLAAWPAKPTVPVRCKFQTVQKYKRAIKLHALNMSKYRRRLTLVSKARQKAIETLFSLGPTPESWLELAELLWADRWLAQFLRRKARKCGARDQLTRGGVVQYVLEKLYYLIISNAGKWAKEMKAGRDWRGWIIRQVPTLARRGAKKELPNKREQPYGGDQSALWQILDLKGRSRELPPDIRTELREALQWCVKQLSPAERELFQAIFSDQHDLAKLAGAMGIKQCQLAGKCRRLRAKLLDMLRIWFWRGLGGSLCGS